MFLCVLRALYESGTAWLASGKDYVEPNSPFNTRFDHVECPSESADRSAADLMGYADVPKYGTVNYTFSGGDWQDAGHL